ncbi:hypothetical protein AGMMS49949_02830 [Alphaproteobacteria bacterium]|nr:hypothetical protein AGMMS49949_02830 [Alphaproteobacteria bacterium]GHS97326.1 hypothetical protein AGMMS50296_4220 [Alphaproteobacteria bacterium]
MVYKMIWIGLGVFMMLGIVYLGTAGICVVKRSVQMEVPLQTFLKQKGDLASKEENSKGKVLN